jgi:hypothetical protein
MDSLDYLVEEELLIMNGDEMLTMSGNEPSVNPDGVCFGIPYSGNKNVVVIQYTISLFY